MERIYIINQNLRIFFRRMQLQYCIEITSVTWLTQQIQNEVKELLMGSTIEHLLFFQTIELTENTL